MKLITFNELKLFMKTSFVFMILNLMLIYPSQANDRVGNGGAGVFRDGRYLTFQSARIEILPLDQREVSGLNKLISTVKDFPIHSLGKARLLNSLIPIGGRMYYKLSHLSDEEREELIQEYADVLGENSQGEIELYAITKGKETYLLPSFDKLSLIEKQAILVHEAAWVLNQHLNYETVVKFEMLFQKYLERNQKKFDINLIMQLGIVLNDPTFALASAAADDLTNGRLHHLLNKKGALPYKVLFGDNELNTLQTGNLHCLHYPINCERHGVYLINPIYEGYFQNLTAVQSHLLRMINNYPAVNTFRVLLSLVPRIYRARKHHYGIQDKEQPRTFVKDNKYYEIQYTQATFKLWEIKNNVPTTIVLKYNERSFYKTYPTFQAQDNLTCVKFKKSFLSKRKCVKWEIDQKNFVFDFFIASPRDTIIESDSRF